MSRTIKTILLITAATAAFISCRHSYNLVSGEYTNLKVSHETVLPDSQMISIYGPYKSALDAEMNHVIGFSTTEMIKGKPESKLTNYLADLLLEESRLISAEAGARFIPDISFMNYGGIRTGIPKGEIQVRKVFELMPFENELVILKLKGSDLRAFFDLIASQGGDSMSGARFVIRNRKAEQITVGGNPLDDKAAYWLATSDYVADGGDSFAMLKNSLERFPTGEKIRDVMIRHMKRTHAGGHLIDPVTDGRISDE